MSAIPLKRLQLHSPLFVGRTNLKDNLDSMMRQDLKLEYDRESQEVRVTFNGETAIIPTSAVAAMVPFTLITPEPKPEPPKAKHPIKAQISTPTGHVFGGEGAGQTGSKF
jgi:hypothetical protein